MGLTKALRDPARQFQPSDLTRFSLMVKAALLSPLASALGWAYVVCWGVSLYPPVLLNKQLRSVEGVSLDTTFLNFFGCVAYLVSVCMLYYSPVVRAEYALRHGGTKYPLVRFNDVVYGSHSLVLVAVVLWQFYYAGYRKTLNQRLSRPVKYILVAGVLVAMGLLVHAWEINNTARHYELVDVAQIFGAAKVFLSCIKYIPQVYWNHKRRSTKGFAVSGAVLDIFGAVFSTSQLFLDGYLVNDLDGVFKNPVKLLLAGVTAVFDVIFICQLFLYRDLEQDVSVYNKNQ